MPATEYGKIIRKFNKIRAWIVGDAIIDVYHFGRVDRISPEAPVPIFIQERTESRRGGANNVAHQIEALGCCAWTTFAPPYQWSYKHRYMAGHHHLFRIDRDVICNEELPRHISEKFDVIILSDYRKGVLSDTYCEDIINDANRAGVPVVVDPKGTNWYKYRGANFICPNENEWEGVNTLHPKGTTMIVKMGAKGLGIKKDDEYPMQMLDAHAKHVYDVTGAGDTVVAVFAASIGAGASVEDAAHIANVAAGYVVGEVGTRVCPVEKLSELLSI